MYNIMFKKLSAFALLLLIAACSDNKTGGVNISEIQVSSGQIQCEEPQPGECKITVIVPDKTQRPQPASVCDETSLIDFYEIDLNYNGIFFPINRNVPFMCSDEVQIKPYAEAYLSQNIKKNILVEGYACDLGEDDYNMELSKRRAEYVKKALVSAGIPENRIKIKWYGSTMFRKAGFGPKEYYRRAQISLR